MEKRQTNLVLRLFWHHVWRYPRYAIGILISTPSVVLVSSIIPPLIIANILNRLATNNYIPGQVWASFGTSLVIFTLFAVIGPAAGWRIVDRFVWKLEGNVERDIAQRVYRHLLEQGANFHANNFGGSLVSHNNKLMGAYIRFADTIVFQVIPMVSTIIFATIILSRRAPIFAIVLVIFALIYSLTAFLVTRPVRELNAELASLESEQTGYLADSVTNIMAIKSFAGGEYEKKQFSKATNRSYNKLLQIMRASQKQFLYFSAMTNGFGAVALIIAVIGIVVLHNNLATMFLIVSYTGLIANMLFTFSNNSLRNFNRAIGDASDMTLTLELEPEIKDPKNPEKPRIQKGTIELDDVTFTHEGINEALFHNLSLSIRAGEKIGLVGHSGSGKSTFTRLLLRFSDIDSGSISIDGQNIAHITQDDLRRHIAYVPQEPIMFHRSLHDNIAYGRLDAPEKDILQAAKLAHADEFIKELPQGYETLVGERGVKLSGGQRQRVAIARAMLKDAPILVLDEATSALDSESEVLIQDALWKLMEGRTAIVIAHRLSTVQKMDRIIVMDDGKISQEGTHKELLKKGGTYADLWAHQSGGFLED